MALGGSLVMCMVYDITGWLDWIVTIHTFVLHKHVIAADVGS